MKMAVKVEVEGEEALPRGNLKTVFYVALLALLLFIIKLIGWTSFEETRPYLQPYSSIIFLINPYLAYIQAVLVFVLGRCYINALYYKIGHSVIHLSRTLYRNVEMEGIRKPRISEMFDLAVGWILSLSQRVYSSVELGYFEAFNRRIAESLAKVSQWAYPSVELGCFEMFNQKVAENVTKLSEKLRETQTGILSYYVGSSLRHHLASDSATFPWRVIKRCQLPHAHRSMIKEIETIEPYFVY